MWEMANQRLASLLSRELTVVEGLTDAVNMRKPSSEGLYLIGLHKFQMGELP